MHKPYRWILRGLTGILLFGLIGLMVVMILTYEAMPEAKQMIELDDVRLENGMYILEPHEFEANIVIYQGGLVQTEAYLVLANLLKEEGFRVFLPKMPLNLAIINQNALLEIQTLYPSDLEWIGVGHSLGGATLSFVAENLDVLILLGAYPASSQDLSELDIQVLSITAEFDEVLNQDNFENTKSLLPDATIYEVILGGNHAYFGFYGAQRGDGAATITRLQQHQMTVSLIVEFIRG